MTSATAPLDPACAKGLFDLGAIGAGLTFAESLGALAAALQAGGAGASAVVQAPPGTGKTTLVPPLLANIAAGGRGGRPRIVVTQPRRVAARAAARRLAALDGTRLGDRVGYTVRGERQTGPGTVIEFVTPGILLRRLLADPGLEGTDAVILDEVHERGLETDLLVGMLAEVRQLRGDLALVAMSATLDAPRFAALIGDALIGAAADGNDDGGGPAPVIDCPSVLFPLDVEWAPAPAPRLDERGVARAFLDHVADTAAAGHAAALAGGRDWTPWCLFPAPGRFPTWLRGSAAGAAPRFWNSTARPPPAEQDRAVSGREPGGAARIIVSTALAESSLTVPGVRLVIDSGLSREPRRDAGRGMSGLVTVSCSRASADQRAGRAARQGPGTVIRCYDQRAFGAAPAHPTPEIAAADLTGAALVLACWGAPGGRGLALPDAPPRAAMDEAVEVLRELGAVTADGHATEVGKTLARVPTDPRLARALLDGAATVGYRTAAEAVALVSGDQRAPGADLTRLLAALRTGRDPGSRRWSEDVRRMESIARQESTGGGHQKPSGAAPVASAGAVGAAEAIGFVVALAFPDRVARRVPGQGPAQYLLTSGTRAGLPAGSALSGHEWLGVAEVSRAQGRDAAGTGAVIRSAAPLTADTAEAAAGNLLSDTLQARFSQGRVSARRERRLGAIVLSSTPVRPPAEEGRAAVARALASEGLADHRMVERGGRLAPPSCPAAPGAGRGMARRFRAGVAGPAGGLAGPGARGVGRRGIDGRDRPRRPAEPAAAVARGGPAGRTGTGVAGGPQRIPDPDRLPGRGRRHRPARSGRQAAGVLWLGRDAAAGRRARAGAVPPALAGPPAPGRDRRSRIVLVRALRPGPGRNARPLSAASVARRPMDRARDSPDQAAELTPDQQPGAAN